METLIDFCRRTGRRVSQAVNDLIRKLTARGQLRIAVAISIPFIAKFEIGYHVHIERKQEKAA